jgi:hypothetical protein
MRRAARPEPADGADGAAEAEVIRLPVPVGQVKRIDPRPNRDGNAATFAAQLIGQDGARRGLRAGAELIDSATDLYNRTEWSGAKDRRTPKGAKTRTQA